MSEDDQQQLGKVLWAIANSLRGSMDADDFRDYMLSFLFLRYLSDNYIAAIKKELRGDYPDNSATPKIAPLQLWYEQNAADVEAFEIQMRRKVHYVIEPQYLWDSIAEMARMQNGELLNGSVEY